MQEQEQTLLPLRRMGDRPKCDCGLVLVRPSVGFQRPHNVGTGRQVLRSSCTREGRPRTNQTLLTLLPSRHNLSLRLSTAFSHMSSRRGRRAAAVRQVFERSTARYLHLCRTSGRRRMKGNVLCRRQLSSFIPNTLLAVTPAKIGIQAKCPEKLPNSFCPILFH